MSTDINIKKKISIEEEGALLTTDVNNINFVGAGVTASTLGNDVTVTVAGGNGSVIYYLNQTVTQAPYKEFSSIVTTAVEQVVPATIAGGVTTIIAEYQTPVGIPNTTVIPAGLWQFFLHFNAGSAGQNWIIRPTVYKRDSGGTETLIFTPDPEIVTNMSTTTTMYTCDGVFPTTSLLTTDRIVVKIALQNTTGVSQTASFRTEGSQHYSVAATTLNQAVSAGSVTSVSGTAPIVSSGGSTPAISIPQATALVDGYLSSSDWSVFNAKVPATRNLTINGTTYDLSADRTWTIATGSSGVFGIADTSGVYTYYATFALARAAATSGQTIELFADVIETTNISAILKDGVNINGNGHTYTLSQAGIASSFSDNGVAVVCDISNIIIRRAAGTASVVNTLCLSLTAASKITGNALCISSCSTAIGVNNASAELNGLVGICITNFYGIYSTGILKNVYGETYSADYHYSIYSTGTAVNCHGVGFGLYQYAFYNGGIAVNCSGTITGNFGGGFYNAGTAENCTGKSVGTSGFFSSGTSISCTGVSVSGNGFNINASGTMHESCSGYSTSGSGIYCYGGRLINCTGISGSGYGITAVNGNDTQMSVVKCTGISTGSSGMYANYAPNNGGLQNCSLYSYYNSINGRALELGTYANSVVGCTMGVTSSSAASIYCASAINFKYINNTFTGSTTPIVNITQAVTNTQDNQGNILL